MKTTVSIPYPLRALALIVLAGAATSPSRAQTTFTWTGASNGTWGTASNWNPSTGAPPGTATNDIASFGTSATTNISLGSATTIGNLKFLSGADAYTLGGSTLTISGVATSSANLFLDNSSGNLQTISANLTLNSTSGTSIYMNVGAGGGLTLSGLLTASGTANRSILVQGGGTLNLTGTTSGINQLSAIAGTTLNYNTTASNGINNFIANGGRINLLRATGTTGISVQLFGTGSEMYLSTAGLTVGAVNLNFRGDSAGQTKTFGANFGGTGTATYTGTVNLNTTSATANNTYRLFAASGNTAVFSGSIRDSFASASGTKLEITGAGVVRFSGSAANTSITPIVIDGGTLELAKTAGVDAIAGGSVTVNTGGTLRLAASNQIGNATALAFAGGTFDAGAFAESLGALSVGASGGSIRFDGSAGSLTFASLSSIAGTLTISGWTDGASIVFTDGSAWDETALSRVVFTGYGEALFDSLTGELYASAIPEPSTTVLIIGAAALVGSVAFRRRPSRGKHPAAAVMRRSTAGFTLVELLTVIAIIGILAAVVIPVIARTRQSARATQCLANLRQVGAAILLSTHDNRGLLPYGYRSGGTYWNHTVDRYLGQARPDDKQASSSVLFCPQESVEAAAGSNRTNYIVNSILMPERKSDTTPQVVLAGVSRPSQLVLATDGTVNSNGVSDWGFYNQTGLSGALAPSSVVPDETSSGSARISWRHDGRTQVVFLDNHTACLPVGGLLNMNLRPGS